MDKAAKKFILKAISLLLLVVLASSFSVSCRPGVAPDGTSASVQTSEGPDESENGSAVTEIDSFKLIDNGKPCAKVIRPDDAKEYDISTLSAIKIKNMLQDLLDGSKQPIGTDWTQSGKHDPETIEILVGRTSYSEGSAEIDALGLGSFIVKAFGNKIIVCSNCAAGYEKAVEYLSELFGRFLTADGSSHTLDIPREELATVSVFNEGLENLPSAPSGTSVKCVYDSGEGCEEVIISGADRDAFDSYEQSITSSKYYTESDPGSDLAGNLFRNFHNSKYSLILGFYPKTSEIRAVVGTFSQKSLEMQSPDQKFTSVTSCAVTMIGVSYVNSAGETKNNGLSILIRLKDGRFIVIDGGFNTASHARVLINTIKEQFSRYSSSGFPTIAAWMITHAHGDHFGVLNGRNTMISDAGIKVQTVMVNYLSQYELERSRDSFTNNWDATEGDGYVNTYKAAENLGAELVAVHTGQTYYFPGLTVEILYTLENLAPSPMNAMNSTSVISRMTFTDGDRRTVFISTGDATGAAFAISSVLYGDFLKSDMVSVAHHGGSTWGNDAGTASAYMIIKPPVVLWPAGTGGYESKKTKSYNRVLIEKTTNENFRELYVSGALGAITELEMPYSPGSAKVTAP